MRSSICFAGPEKEVSGETQCFAGSLMMVIAWVRRQIADALSNSDTLAHAIQPKHVCTATCRTDESQQKFDGCAFARAVGTEKATDRITRYLQVQVL